MKILKIVDTIISTLERVPKADMDTIPIKKF